MDMFVDGMGVYAFTRNYAYKQTGVAFVYDFFFPFARQTRNYAVDRTHGTSTINVLYHVQYTHI